MSVYNNSVQPDDTDYSGYIVNRYAARPSGAPDSYILLTAGLRISWEHENDNLKENEKS